jgi:hypothetical protein
VLCGSYFEVLRYVADVFTLNYLSKGLSSSVSIVPDYRLDDCGSIPGGGRGSFL